jgi:hypothetical protein
MGMELVAPSQRNPLLGVIDPDANAAGTLVSAYGDGSIHESFWALVSAGDLGTNGTLDAKLIQAQDSSGAGAKDIAGTAITQFTQAGTDRSNKQAFINVESEDLDKANGYRWVALSITGATATSDFAGYLFGANPKYGFGTHIASVIETIGVRG